MPFENLPPPAGDGWVGWSLTLLSAFVGRLMYHGRSAQRGVRPFIGWHLVWDIPVAIGCCWVAAGACAYAGVSGTPALSAVAIASYLGPGFAEAIVWRLVDRWVPKAESKK